MASLQWQILCFLLLLTGRSLLWMLQLNFLLFQGDEVYARGWDLNQGTYFSLFLGCGCLKFFLIHPFI